jgi:cell division protein FtsB
MFFISARRLLFTGYIFFWGFFFIFGQQGYLAYNRMLDEVVILRANLFSLKERNSFLQKEILSWEKKLFWVERYARERLQLVFPNDVVYFIS